MSITPWHIYLLAIGPFVGSFLGLVAHRWPKGEPVAVGRSRCDTCGKPLHPLDMIPLISALARRFRCRYCGAYFGVAPWLWEIAGLAVVIPVLWVAGPVLALLTAGLGWALLLLAGLDARHFWLPDMITLPLIAGGLIYTYSVSPQDVPGNAVGAAVAYGGIWGINTAYRMLRGRDGIGMGDAKLLAALAAWTGPFAIAPALLVASASALIYVLARQVISRNVSASTPIPLGVFLASAFYAIWLWQMLDDVNFYIPRLI